MSDRAGDRFLVRKGQPGAVKETRPETGLGTGQRPRIVKPGRFKGFTTSAEIIRPAVMRYAPSFAAEIQRKRMHQMRSRSNRQGHPDEGFVQVDVERHLPLWAVDDEGGRLKGRAGSRSRLQQARFQTAGRYEGVKGSRLEEGSTSGPPPRTLALA
jgi:hypothetical protein